MRKCHASARGAKGARSRLTAGNRGTLLKDQGQLADAEQLDRRAAAVHVCFMDPFKTGVN